MNWICKPDQKMNILLHSSCTHTTTFRCHFTAIPELATVPPQIWKKFFEHHTSHEWDTLPHIQRAPSTVKLAWSNANVLSIYWPMLILPQLSTCWLSEAGCGGGQHMATGQTMHHNLQARAWCLQSLDDCRHTDQQHHITSQWLQSPSTSLMLAISGWLQTHRPAIPHHITMITISKHELDTCNLWMTADTQTSNTTSHHNDYNLQARAWCLQSLDDCRHTGQQYHITSQWLQSPSTSLMLAISERLQTRQTTATQRIFISLHNYSSMKLALTGAFKPDYNNWICQLPISHTEKHDAKISMNPHICVILYYTSLKSTLGGSVVRALACDRKVTSSTPGQSATE